jgi:hypothetical protein
MLALRNGICSGSEGVSLRLTRWLVACVKGLACFEDERIYRSRVELLIYECPLYLFGPLTDAQWQHVVRYYTRRTEQCVINYRFGDNGTRV